MSDIKVNKVVRDALSEADKSDIAIYIEEFGVRKNEQYIAADTDTPPPSVTPQINDSSGDEKYAGWILTNPEIQQKYNENADLATRSIFDSCD